MDVRAFALSYKTSYAEHTMPLAPQLIDELRKLDSSSARDAIVTLVRANPTLVATLEELLAVSPSATEPGLMVRVRRAVGGLSDELPPLAPERAAVGEPEFVGEGLWLRLESVPCRNARCKKKPDLHGPYWYSYRRVDSEWRMKYEGKEKPKLVVGPSIDSIRALLGRLDADLPIDDEELKQLNRAIVHLSNLKSADARVLRAEAAALIEAEQHRRGSEIEARQRTLLAKSGSGKGLTEAEQKELEDLTTFARG